MSHDLRHSILRLIFIGAMLGLTALLTLTVALGSELILKLRSLKRRKPATGAEESFLHGAVERLRNAYGFLELQASDSKSEDDAAAAALYLPPGPTEFDSEEERIRYLLAEYPGLVRKGKFVEAMRIVNASVVLVGLYRMFDRSSSWLGQKTKHRTDSSEQIETQMRARL